MYLSDTDSAGGLSGSAGSHYRELVGAALLLLQSITSILMMHNKVSQLRKQIDVALFVLTIIIRLNHSVYMHTDCSDLKYLGLTISYIDVQINLLTLIYYRLCAR